MNIGRPIPIICGVERCVYDIQVLKLTYCEVGVVSVIVGIIKIEGSHGAFDVVEGIITQNGSQTKSGFCCDIVLLDFLCCEFYSINLNRTYGTIAKK